MQHLDYIKYTNYIYILNSKEYKQSCNDGVNTKGFLELHFYIYILNSKEYKQSCNDGVNTKGFMELHFFEHYKYITIKPFSPYNFFGTNLHHHEKKTARCAFNHKPISYTSMYRTQTRPRDYQQSQQHLLETSYTRS